MTTVPIAGETYTFGVGLVQQADTRLLQAAPTIAAGDFQRSVNGGAFGNLTNLPTVTPAGGTRVEIVLSAAETTAAGAGGEIWVRWIDAAGAEWCDGYQALRVGSETLETLGAAIDLNTSIISPVGGTTDGNGAVGGTTVLDSTRAEATGHWNNLTLQITSGVCEGQSRTIQTYTIGVGFTFVQPFTAQIVAGVTYRIIAAVVYQPGITVTKNHPVTVEPDTNVIIGVSIVTNTGQPGVAELTVGTMTINRIRAGVATPIVVAAACTAAIGNVFYTYTFPAASWQAGDQYQAYMLGQEVAVNGISYDVSAIVFDGRVSREPEVADDVLDAAVDGAYTLRESVRIANAALAGKSSGGFTDTVRFRDINDTTTRINATVNNVGDRLAVTLDAT